MPTAARAARQLLEWMNLKPHSINGLPGHPSLTEIATERMDLVFKGERGSAEVTLARSTSDGTSITVACMINQERLYHGPLEEDSIVELGEHLRERIGPISFDHAELFRIQGTNLCASTPCNVIQAFFDSVRLEEDSDPDVLHEVEVEALDPIPIEQVWLIQKSRHLVDVFEESFEDAFVDAIIPENGLLEDDHRQQAVEFMLGALLRISSLFIAREVVASRYYGQDEVLIIMAHLLNGSADK